jgi:hypothetical protein
MAIAPHVLSAIFRSGDLTGFEPSGRIRPRHIAQYWVVTTCLRDPVLAVRVYKELLGPSSRTQTHAADRFLGLLETAKDRPFALWWHEVLQKRRTVPLPA